RLNELALANDENLKAALSSVKDIGEFDPVAARELFFHWHRINRMYRAWFLWKKWVIRKKDYENIVKNYATTLRLKAGPQLATLGQRGYENDFIIDLMAAIKNAKDPDAIDVSGSETLSPMPEAVKPSDDSGPHAS
ncbi:MAG: hypothetical protein VX378_15265, partial [Pseudomonadota bacterium]|nr:hypothetical protein [Pseudomonadota bacterium]